MDCPDGDWIPPGRELQRRLEQVLADYHGPKEAVLIALGVVVAERLVGRPTEALTWIRKLTGILTREG